MNQIYIKHLINYLKENEHKGTVIGFSLYLERKKAPYTSESFCRNVCKRAEAKDLISYRKGDLYLLELKRIMNASLKQNQATIKRQREQVKERDKEWIKRKAIESQL